MPFALRPFVTAAMLGSLAACGGSTTPPTVGTPMSSQSVRSLGSKVPILYFVDHDNQAVYLLNALDITAPPIGKITNGINTPVAVAADTKGVLYVGNQTGEVQVYQPGSQSPSRSITPAHGAVSSIAVSPDGTLVIASGGIFTDGGLLIFDKGSRQPTRSIDIPLGNNDETAVTAGVDAKDEIDYSFHHYPRPDAGNVLLQPGSLQGVNTGRLPDVVGGFDRAGNLYMTTGTEIDEYFPGAKTPSRRITNGLTSASLFAVAPNGKLYVPNTLSQSAPGNLVEYSATSAKPIATLSGSNDPYPVSSALGPPLA
jgi:WD40 repeat protein